MSDRANIAILISLVAAVASVGSAAISWRSLRSHQDAALFATRLQICTDLNDAGINFRAYYIGNRTPERQRQLQETIDLGVAASRRAVLVGPRRLTTASMDLVRAGIVTRNLFENASTPEDREAQSQVVDRAQIAVQNACQAVFQERPTLGL